MGGDLMKWTCVFYVSDSGRIPVKKFMDSLSSRTQQKFLAVVGMLEKFGKNLNEPHMKMLGKEIYELRFSGQEGPIRVLHFFYDGKKIVFTNGFVKKTNKAPKKEIELAEQRRKIYLNRKMQK